MRLHDLGDHLVLLRHLRLQGGVLLFQPPAFSVRSTLEGGGAVLEELLLPLVKHGGVQSLLVAHVRYRNLVNQVPFQNPLYPLQKISCVFQPRAFPPSRLYLNRSRVFVQFHLKQNTNRRSETNYNPFFHFSSNSSFFPSWILPLFFPFFVYM